LVRGNVAAALLLGGAWSPARGGEPADRVVGPVACVEGVIPGARGGMYFLA
jgi:hypothetical protein